MLLVNNCLILTYLNYLQGTMIKFIINLFNILINLLPYRILIETWVNTGTLSFFARFVRPWSFKILLY